MSTTRISLNLLLVSVFALGACGGSGEAAGLKYRVSDKELRGLTGDGVIRIETAKGEVTQLEDAFALGTMETNEKKQGITATDAEKKAAADAIDAAADKIGATTDSQEKELAAARAERDAKIAAAKQKYDETTKMVREKYAREQEKNRKTLEDAKTSKAIAVLQESLLKAELAENKARQDLRKQEIRVAKAKLEVVRLEELHNMTGANGPKETQRKIEFEQQAVNEQRKLVELQTRLQKQQAATAAERARFEAERQKLGTPMKPTPAPE